MEARTALLVALAGAVGLPYLTVALVRGGGGTLFLVGVLFVAVFLLVVWSDVGGDVEADTDGGAARTGADADGGTTDVGNVGDGDDERAD